MIKPGVSNNKIEVASIVPFGVTGDELEVKDVQRIVLLQQPKVQSSVLCLFLTDRRRWDHWHGFSFDGKC